MKKSLFLLAAAIFTAAFVVCGSFTSCGTKPEATVSGTVTGVADGTKVFMHDNAGAKLDSTTVAGGKFRFEIAKAYPDMNHLSFDGSDKGASFFVEPGAIIAMLDYTATPETLIFTGTPTNDGLAELREGTADFNDRMSAMVRDVIAAQGTPAYDDLLAKYMELQNGREQYITKMILENPNTVLAALLINDNAPRLTTPAEVDSVLNIIAEAPANAFTDRLRERREALALTAVGAEAPDFTQAQPDGTPLALSSLRGKLVLVDFWASWCGPCRRENPNVVKLYDRFKDRGFDILGVSLDSDRDAWLKAIEDDGLGWRHVAGFGEGGNIAASLYAVNSIPYTVLVGADGVIIAKNLRGADLEAKVAEVLGGVIE